MNYYSNREDCINQLAKVVGLDYSNQIFEIIKSNYNVYGIETEFVRMNAAFRLACKGCSAPKIIELCKRQVEQHVLVCLEHERYIRSI